MELSLCVLLTMSNDTHVTDVGGLVHELTDLVYGKVTVDIGDIIVDQSAIVHFERRRMQLTP